MALTTVEISVRDDGVGLDLERLRAAAIVRGKTLAGADDQAIAETIIESGVSTALKLTPIAGRGVGLDAVRAYVKGLGGTTSLILLGTAAARFRPFCLTFSLPLPESHRAA